MVSSISTVSKVPLVSKVAETQGSHGEHFVSKVSSSPKQSVEQIVGGKSSELSADMINKKIEEINKTLEKQQLETSYQRHEETNRLVIRLVDKETKEIVKEIPPEKLLDYAAGMDEILGLFVDKKA